MPFENIIGGFDSKKIQNLNDFENLVYFDQIKNVPNTDIKLSNSFQRFGKDS